MNWIVDNSHSEVEFTVKHLMISTVKGRFKTLGGTVVFDPANHTTSEIDVTIDAASVDTHDEKRDGHLKSPDFFDVAQYPTLTFKSTNVEKISDENFKVTGDLTMHGVTKPVVLDVEYGGQGKSPFGYTAAGFTAKTSLNRKDFGLNWNVAMEAGGVMVSEKVNINLEIELIAQPAAVAATV